jgi:hypothetical protein
VAQVSRSLDRLEVVFDEPNLVASAGLLLVATLVARLDVEALINATVRLVGRVGGSSPGAKILTLVNAMVSGGSHIDHTDVLRSGGTRRVVGHRVYAPSTVGTFLRAFSFGHVRQLEAVCGKVLERAWAVGAGPGDKRLVIDVDSTICQVYGRLKAGAAYGYTKVLGYHPILATRSDTGEIIHARMRKGSANTQRGTKRLVEETVARVRRAGAPGEIVMRFDSGYWSNDTIAVLGRLNVRYTMAVRATTKAVAKAITTIDEAAWVPIAYTPDGEAAVAECDYHGRRLIVRRTRLTGAAQAALWPDWRHFAFLTDLGGTAVALDKFHRQHAVVEMTIDDLKEGSGIDHIPSGNFSANGAWLCAAVLAHNLIRWTATIGAPHPVDQLAVAATIRTRLIAVPGRLVNLAGTPTLRGPRDWPWSQWFIRRLARLRALPIWSG